MLKTAYCVDDISDSNSIREIGVDEAGRGPMFGRVYAGAVILPKSLEAFQHALMKDSKKFHSEKKIREVAAYIKANAIAWAVGWADEREIDELNIRRATHKAMHQAITDIFDKQTDKQNILLLVDGNDFTPFIIKEPATLGHATLGPATLGHATLGHATLVQQVQHVCIEGGDNTYSCIAAASILAKVARDDYIAELCAKEPDLITRYDLLKNKGYGTKKHMDGIKKYGITQWHRKTFGICRGQAPGPPTQ
jgi:ribonuclease HII